MGSADDRRLGRLVRVARGEEHVGIGLHAVGDRVSVDIVLGYGSAADPASRLTEVLGHARSSARNASRHLAVIAHVCGTDADPQNRKNTIARLQGAGALVASSNAEAAAWAVYLGTRLVAR